MTNEQKPDQREVMRMAIDTLFVAIMPDGKAHWKDEAIAALRQALAPPESVAAVQLTQRITELTAQHGTLRAAARVLEVDPGYLSRIGSGEKKNVGETLLRRMGLREITTYERIK